MRDRSEQKESTEMMNITLHQRNQIQPLSWQQNMSIAQGVLMMIVATKSLRTIADRRFIAIIYEMRTMTCEPMRERD